MGSLLDERGHISRAFQRDNECNNWPLTISQLTSGSHDGCCERTNERIKREGIERARLHAKDSLLEAYSHSIQADGRYEDEKDVHELEERHGIIVQ